MCGSNDIMSIIPTLFFDVGVPFADNVSDIRLIVEWYSTGNWKFATSMLIPFLLNVSANIYHWWKWDSKREKMFTWLLLILQLWPIYRAIKLSIKVCKKVPGAEVEKKKFEEEVVTLEPYLESLPAVFIMGLAWTTTAYSERNKTAVLGDSPTLFYATFVISVFTSTLGITKYLLKGPFKVLPQQGWLNGMITCRFLFMFLTILVSVMGKAFLTVAYTARFYSAFQKLTNGCSDLSQNTSNITIPQCQAYYWIPSASIVFALMILPQLLMSLCLILRATGSMKKCLTFVAKYPQVCFLPIFTHFVIASRVGGCTSGIQDDVRKRQIILSKRLTILNMLMHAVCGVVCGFVIVSVEGSYDYGGLFFLLIFTLPGIIITLTFLCVGSRCCCKCCITGCCAVEYQYLELDRSIEIGNELKIIVDKDCGKKEGSLAKQMSLDHVPNKLVPSDAPKRNTI